MRNPNCAVCTCGKTIFTRNVSPSKSPPALFTIFFFELQFQFWIFFSLGHWDVTSRVDLETDILLDIDDVTSSLLLRI